MKQEQIFQGVVSLETPYTVGEKGISYKEKLALEISGDISLKVIHEIAKCLNIAYRTGFDEGQAIYSKLIQ
jgi:hypothetical protein